MPRRTGELVVAAAARVFGQEWASFRRRRWPVSVGWVCIHVGFPSVEVRAGKPVADGGLLFERPGGAEKVGAEIFVDRRWAEFVFFRWDGSCQMGIPWAATPSRGKHLEIRPEGTRLAGRPDPAVKGWLVRRTKDWSVEVRRACFGEEHRLCFGPRGVSSDFHSPEEVRFLAQIGERGCGNTLARWREGFGRMGFVFKARRGAGNREHVNSCESTLESWFAQELAVSEIQADWNMLGKTARVRLAGQEYAVKLVGAGGLFRLWKLGIRAEPGRLPIGVKGDTLLVLRPWGLGRKPLVRNAG